MLLATFLFSPTSPTSAAAQQFSVPGAVDLLEKGEAQRFPDSPGARSWLMGMWRGFVEACPGEPMDQGALHRGIGVDPVAWTVRLGQYLLSAVPLAVEGVADGEAWVEANGCEARERIAGTIFRVVAARGDNRAALAHRRQFLSLFAPTVLRTVGRDPDGRAHLTPELSEQAKSLAPAVKRYLRTRLSGPLPESKLRQVATRLSELLVTSEIRQQSFDAMKDQDYDGHLVIHLSRLPLMAASLGRQNDGVTPFSKQQDPIDILAESNMRALMDALAGVGVLPPSRERSDRLEAVLLRDLLDDIREVVPAQLATVVQRMGPRVALSPEATRRRTQLFNVLKEAGIMSGFEPLGRCRVATTERFDQVIAGVLLPVRDHEVVLETRSHPAFKPEDTTELNYVPTAPGRYQKWTVDPRTLSWNAVEREAVGACLRIRIPVGDGEVGAKHVDMEMTSNVFRNSDPLSNGALAVATTKGRASWVEIINDSVRAERTLTILRQYVARLDDPELSETEWELPSSAEDDDALAATAPTSWVDEERTAADSTLADLSREPGFTPFTTPPVIKNQDEVDGLRARLFPPRLRAEGHRYRVQVWVLIDAAGNVVAARVVEPSALAVLDRAAVEVARVMKFSPAKNQATPVPVWTSFPIVFEPSAH